VAISSGKITPIILCGGSGTRLWPRSRAAKPKPFLPLVEDRTLFEQALLRCADAAHFHAPLVVTGAAHVEHVDAQLGLAPDAEIIVEPQSKNTAAAIALAALRLPADSIMLICPSDHHIGDCAAFTKTARSAAELASEGWLVSFGIEPRSPDTGFGYLRRGERIGKSGFKVAQFVEKPDIARAQAYLASGEYAWNGGIFAFGVGTYLEELGRFRPKLYAAVREAAEKSVVSGRRFYPNVEAFNEIEPESVDYAVMENTVHAAMVPADMAWSDIGNWQALHSARKRDQSGNAVRGPVELVDCRNVLVESDGTRVSVIGLRDVIIVVDGGDVLVTSAVSAHKVGKLSGAVNQ
jgi:mannose-1-phosphate guanylyltransferase/mannose-1-phosphate guanylyltransferase/mannose-6-phosphate isomerase